VPYASDIMTTLNNEVGYIGKQNNSNIDDKDSMGDSGSYTKYSYEIDTKYSNLYDQKRNGIPKWSAIFVQWGFIVTYGYEKALDLLYLTEHNNMYDPENFMNLFKNNGVFDNNPKPGDVIFIGSIRDDGQAEISCGLVYKMSGGYVGIIQSAEDIIIQNSIDLNDPVILGFGHPKFTNNVSEGDTLTIHVTPPYESWPYDALPSETPAPEDEEGEEEHDHDAPVFRYNKLYFQTSGPKPNTTEIQDSSDSSGGGEGGDSGDGESSSGPSREKQEYEISHYIESENATMMFFAGEGADKDQLNSILTDLENSDLKEMLETYSSSGGPETKLTLETKDDEGNSKNEQVINVPPTLNLIFKDKYGLSVNSEIEIIESEMPNQDSGDDEGGQQEADKEFNIVYLINDVNEKFIIYIIASGGERDTQVPDGNYDICIYNKSKCSVIQGPEKPLDQYQNMEVNTEDFRGMENLKEVHLFSSSMYGDIGAFAECPNLEVLDIEDTNVYGSLENLGNGSLKVLRASSTAIKCDIKEMNHLSKLEEFYINSTLVYGDIAGISGLTNLKKFEIVGTDIYGDIGAFSNMHKLESLMMEGKLTGDIAQLSNLNNLKDLSISGEGIYGDIAAFKDAPLETVYISGAGVSGSVNENLKDTVQFAIIKNSPVDGDIASFYKCSDLTDLFIQNTNISGDIGGSYDGHSLSSISGIESFSILEKNITGDISSLSNIGSSQYINISDCNVSGSIEGLSFDSINTFQLNSINVSGDIGSTHFGSGIENLSIANTNISGDLSSLSTDSLVKIYLCNNNISGDLAKLKSMESLENIYLYDNNIYGNLSALKGLEEAKYIVIFENKVRGEAKDLEDLENLEVLEFSYDTNFKFD